MVSRRARKASHARAARPRAAKPLQTPRSDADRFGDSRYFPHVESPLWWLARTGLRELERTHSGKPPRADELVKMIRETSDEAIAMIRDKRGQFLIDARADQARAQEKIEGHWRTAFDLLEAFVWHCIEAVFLLEKRLTDDKLLDPTRAEVIIRHAGRATLIGREICLLLRGGFPAAAHARWRTLHEVAVTTTYLRIHGVTAARRIQAHELLQTVNSNLAYLEEAESDDRRHKDREELEALRDGILDEFGATYGGKFDSHYGWAADVVGKARPTFKQIEDAAGMARWRHAYTEVTPHVHSTSRPLHDELLTRHGRDPVAPTWSGLASPAIMTVRSLFQATAAILMYECSWDGMWAAELRTAAALDAVARETMDAFASHEWRWWGLSHRPG